MQAKQCVIVLDFGGQYNQLIARRVRENHVYCEVKPCTTPLTELMKLQPIGFIFTGGPQSVYAEGSPKVDPAIFELGLPILGICYGCQLIAHNLGGKVTAAQEDTAREYGKTETFFDTSCELFHGLKEQSVTWMSHGDYMAKVPEGFCLCAHSEACPTVGICDEARKIYGVQFHPEVNHTEQGALMLRNFLYRVCKAAGDWTMADYRQTAIRAIREKVGTGKALLALSGGVDSSVAAALMAEAIGNQLTCVFVDHGLMRKDEGDFVEKTFTSLFDMHFVRVNCQQHFLDCLKGVTDPEQKRKIIGTEFYKVFWDEVRKQGGNDAFFAQGTIYPDCIESGKGNADKIKTHHNKVKMPDDVKFVGLIEPLASLFKDEVRRVGKQLGIPDELVWRQPFPGPGLGVRIIGEITAEKVKILQEADWVLRDEMKKNGYEREMAQFFCVLPGVSTVGVMGDHRTYDHLLAIRAVTTDDFMTADWARIPYDILATVSNRITNEVKHINRVVYDVTSKPPATVEWE